MQSVRIGDDVGLLVAWYGLAIGRSYGRILTKRLEWSLDTKVSLGKGHPCLVKLGWGLPKVWIPVSFFRFLLPRAEPQLCTVFYCCHVVELCQCISKLWWPSNDLESEETFVYILGVSPIKLNERIELVFGVQKSRRNGL